MPAAVGNRESERLKEVKTVLRSLLISNGKLDVTLPRLNGMYREEDGENIPHREFGYPNLQEFLRSMPDVVFLRYNREHQLCAYHVDTEKSAHVSSLVLRQKKPPKKPKFNVSYKPRNAYGNYSYNYSRPPSQQSTMSTLKALHQILDDLRKSRKYFQTHNGIRKSEILQRFNDRPNQSSITNLQTLNTKLKELSEILVVDEDYVYFKEDIVKSNVNAGSASVQKPVSANFAYQNLQVRSAPSSNLVQRFETDQQVTGYKPVTVINQPAQLGQSDRPPAPQTSQNQMSISMQTDQSKKLLSTDVRQTQKLSEIHHENDQVQDRIRFRVQKLIQKHPEGIWATDFPRIYQQEYNLDLDYHELGFNSIIEFVSAMPKILSITDPDNTGRHMILDAKIPLNRTENRHQTKSMASHYNFDDYIKNNNEAVPHKLSASVCSKFIPEGMMGFDETVEHINVSSLADEDYFEVNISEIFTPSFFWITLRKNKLKIKKLMEELDEFYKHQDLDGLRLPQALVETGLNVACIYTKMWHRAIIKKVKPDGYVVVLFYDYGTVKTYSPNHLYYLHKRFSALPAQALACGLYNIKAPQSNEWPTLSTNEFVSRVWTSPLVATVCETNEDNNTMMITLTDTNDETYDVHINEWMIDKGLAVRGKMENIPSSRYHVPTYGVPLNKLCMYDEDILRKQDQECEKSLNKKQQAYSIEQPHVQDIDSASNYIAESSFDSSCIVSLVRENIDLTKQTNTITQAILLNMPINKLENSQKSVEIPAAVKTTASHNEISPGTNSCSEDIKKISSDFNRNLNISNNNFSGLINDPCADVFKTGSVYMNHNRNYRDSSVSVHSLGSFSSSFDYMPSIKHSSNGLSDHGTSHQSLDSRQSNSDQSQSAQENNHHNQLNNNNNQEYDKLSFTDGTPTFYTVKPVDNSPRKSQTPNKYPSGFFNSVMNQSKINNNASMNGNIVQGSICVKKSDDGYQTAKFSGSTLTSDELSNKSSSKPYTSIELSERCCRKKIHIIHLDNEGWVPVNEFIDCFTNLKVDKIMFKILETFNIDVNYKNLIRADNPQFFSQLDQSRMKAPRESNGNIKSNFVLILLPMRAMLHVLAKLEFVDPKVLKEATILIKQHKEDVEDVLFEQFNNKILYDALNLFVQYREFRRSLMSVG